ncbi:MAG TPA: cysteine peptidase family C39 domain-containing protein, partial [bacterium]|nr:cysteine peptidase family C39 domain-containing protein [bacterium]
MKERLLLDFDRLILEHPEDSFLASLAKVRKASVVRELAFVGRRTYEQALAEAEAVLSDYPEAHPDVRGLATILIVENLVDLGRYEDALQQGEYFLSCKPEETGQTRQAAATHFFMAKAWIALGCYDRAAELLEALLDRYEPSQVFKTELPRALETVQTVYLDWGTRRSAAGDHAGASRAYTELLLRHTDGEMAARARLELAKEQYRLGEYRTAGLLFRDLAVLSPGTRESDEADEWIAKMFRVVPEANQDAMLDRLTFERYGICGPFALQRILEVFEVRERLQTIVERARTDESGTSIRDMVAACLQSGLRAQVVLVDRAKWALIPVPAIGLSDSGSYFAVLGVKGALGLMDIYDQFGRRTAPAESVMSDWDGLAILVGET